MKTLFLFALSVLGTTEEYNSVPIFCWFLITWIIIAVALVSIEAKCKRILELLEKHGDTQ